MDMAGLWSVRCDENQRRVRRSEHGESRRVECGGKRRCSVVHRQLIGGLVRGDCVERGIELKLEQLVGRRCVDVGGFGVDGRQCDGVGRRGSVGDGHRGLCVDLGWWIGSAGCWRRGDGNIGVVVWI